MKRLMSVIVLVLAGCDGTTMTTPEGCPIMVTEIGQAYTQRCIANARIEQARASGGTVTECFDTAGGTTCVTN